MLDHAQEGKVGTEKILSLLTLVGKKPKNDDVENLKQAVDQKGNILITM